MGMLPIRIVDYGHSLRITFSNYPHFQIFKLFPTFAIRSLNLPEHPLPLQRQAGAQRKSRFLIGGAANVPAGGRTFFGLV